MSSEFILYTVTSHRAPFYAVVELGAGHVWTAPTKDGAIRQARDAGVTQFIERTTSREAFLRSLGITDDARPSVKHEPETPHQPAAKPEPKSGTWFVPAAGTAEEAPVSTDFSLPRAFRMGKNKVWPATEANPFAPIPIASVEKGFEAAAGDDDILIVPSTQGKTNKKTPFTDVAPPPTPLSSDEDTL